MSRPQIIVTITEALARRGTPTETGRAFLTYAGVAGPDTPVKCTQLADAIAAAVPAGVAAWVGDALAVGVPEVYVVRTAAANVAAVTQPEWDLGLTKFGRDLGIGQVLIPGVTTPAAYGALQAHAALTGRTPLLDSASVPVVATTVTSATGLAAAAGAKRTGFITPWVKLPAGGGATREVPGSVIAAGLAARGDAAVGHANNAPAFDQGRGAGVVTQGVGVTKTFTGAELDTLYDAGISPIVMRNGLPTLEGWVSVSDDDTYRQLNTGRMLMEIAEAITAGAYQFQGRQIDAAGKLYSDLEGWLRGYLQRLWETDALYGETADEAFDVDVASVNNRATAAAGELRASVAAHLTQHTEKVLFDVAISIA